MRRIGLISVLVAVVGLVAACGDDSSSDASGASGEQPTVVVTTSILGDVVESFAGDQVDVVTIMPVGADPHAFQASAQQAEEMQDADVLIVNGAGFEEGLLDIIESAEDDGTPTFEAIAAVDTIEFGAAAHDHDEHADEDDHDHEDEATNEDDHEGHDHDHDGTDPHFFTDPARMAVSVDAMADFMIDNLDDIDTDALRSSADEYIAELETVDAEAESNLAGVPEDQRILITDHDVFGYFADRYDFEVVGTVIPSGSTTDGASAGELAELAEVIETEGVPAIFVGTTVSDGLSQTLADEVGSEIEVVELFTGSLGEEGSEGATYLDYIRTNAERIAGALS